MSVLVFPNRKSVRYIKQLPKIALPDYHKQIMDTTSCIFFIWSVDLNELLIQLWKLLLTVECHADAANWKTFAFLLTFRQEVLQSIFYILYIPVTNSLLSLTFRQEVLYSIFHIFYIPVTNSLLSSKIEDC